MFSFPCQTLWANYILRRILAFSSPHIPFGVRFLFYSLKKFPRSFCPTFWILHLLAKNPLFSWFIPLSVASLIAMAMRSSWSAISLEYPTSSLISCAFVSISSDVKVVYSPASCLSSASAAAFYFRYLPILLWVGSKILILRVLILFYFVFQLSYHMAKHLLLPSFG